MDAVEFIKTRARICRAYDDCVDCILSDFCGHTCDKQDMYQIAEQAIANVLEWSKEHPVKTRQSELLKLFPNTPRYQDGCIDMCPCEVGCLLMEDDDSVCVHNEDGVKCDKCKRDFWLKEIE